MLARGIQLAGFFIDPLRSALCHKNTDTSFALLTRLEPLARQIRCPLQIGCERSKMGGIVRGSSRGGQKPLAVNCRIQVSPLKTDRFYLGVVAVRGFIDIDRAHIRKIDRNWLFFFRGHQLKRLYYMFKPPIRFLIFFRRV
jgi:hypothetical protein